MTDLERPTGPSVDVAAPDPPNVSRHALARLPDLPGTADPYWRLVTAFLVGYPPHSSRAYFSDLRAWYVWCAHAGVHPLQARRHHVDVWVRHLSEAPQPRTDRPASPASIARRLSCLSRFYDYAIKDAELVDYSPVANVRRPKVSDDSSTVGLTAEQLDALLAAAEQHGPRSAALISLLVYNGLRISEVLATDVEHSTHQRGHRVLRIVRKGGMWGIHLTGLEWRDRQSPSRKALSTLPGRVPGVVSDRRRLPGLPRVAAMAGWVRLPRLRARRWLEDGRRPLQVRGLRAAHLADGGHDP